MWRRDDPASEAQQQPEVTPASEPARPMSRAVARTKASTLAERAKYKDAPLEPRIVSMGMSEIVQTVGMHGETTVVEVELFVDLDHRERRYIRLPGGPLTPLYDNQSKRDSVVHLRPMPASSRPANRFAVEAPPEPPPVRISA